MAEEAPPQSAPVSNMASLSSKTLQTTICRLDELPRSVAEHLVHLDINKDGTIDFQELVRFSDAGRRAVLQQAQVRARGATKSSPVLTAA